MLSGFNHVLLFVTLWTIVPQAPLYMEFSRQEYWTELSFPSPGDLPDPGIEPVSLTTPALADGFFATVPPEKPLLVNHQWRRQWHPTPVLLPRKSHGRRSMVGYSPWGRKESDRTEQLHFHFLSGLNGGL